MYWEKLKEAFNETRIISERNPREVFSFTEKCRERLCEMLGEDGTLLLEQYVCCLEILSKSGEFHKNK